MSNKENKTNTKTSKFTAFLNSNLFQKNLLWWIPLLSSALVCIYALIMSTPIAPLMFVEDTVYTGNSGQLFTKMGDFLAEMKPLNDQVLLIGIFAVIFSLLLKLTRSDVRKKFYISNIVYTCTSFVYYLFSFISLLMIVINYQNMYFNKQDFSQLAQSAASQITATSATWVFILGYIVSILMLVSACGFLGLFIGKFSEFKDDFKVKLENEKTSEQPTNIK